MSEARTTGRHPNAQCEVREEIRAVLGLSGQYSGVFRSTRPLPASALSGCKLNYEEQTAREKRAGGLKSVGPKGLWGFKSPSRHLRLVDDSHVVLQRRAGR